MFAKKEKESVKSVGNNNEDETKKAQVKFLEVQEQYVQNMENQEQELSEDGYGNLNVFIIILNWLNNCL